MFTINSNNLPVYNAIKDTLKAFDDFKTNGKMYVVMLFENGIF